MGRWLDQLRTVNNPETLGGGTDKTDKTPLRIGSVSSVSGPSGAFENFQSGWDASDWQFAFDERAAILEFDEGLSRSEAARLARHQIDEQRRMALQ